MPTGKRMRLEKRQENTGDSWHHKIQSPLKAQQNTRIEISLKLRSGETKDGALMNRHVDSRNPIVL